MSESGKKMSWVFTNRRSVGDRFVAVTAERLDADAKQRKVQVLDVIPSDNAAAPADDHRLTPA